MQQAKDNHPNFRDFGYQVIEQLGINHTGGRFTFKAIDLKNNQSVVIKQFRFATSNSGWDGYKTLEREIKTLQKINHPQIPKYITSFDSGDGLCLVMEYIDGVPLSSRTFEIEEVYALALALLEILTYIHSMGIIHRDIKPENILINEKKVYLIDFGLASFTENNQSMAVSSMVAGTIGLIPPEQLFNKKVTTKSDIYSLGVTIFCLLMRQKTNWISSIIDSSFRIRVREYLAEEVSEEFIGWLEKCVDSNLEYRFQSTKKTLIELKKVSTEKNAEGLKIRDRDENELGENLLAGFLSLLTITPFLLILPKPIYQIIGLIMNSEGDIKQELNNHLIEEFVPSILLLFFFMFVTMILVNFMHNRY